MFIISKIVRGRRLLHEMEEDTKEEELKKHKEKKKEKDLPTIEEVSPNTSTQVSTLDYITSKDKSFLL